MFENERNRYNDENLYNKTVGTQDYNDIYNTGNNVNTQRFDNNGDVADRNVNSYEWGHTPVNNQPVRNTDSFNHYGTIEDKPKKEKKPISKGFVAAMLIISIVCSGVLGVFGGIGAFYLMSDGKGVSGGVNISTNENTGGSEGSADGTVLSTEAISNKVADSVVEIVTETVSYSYFYGQAVSEGAGSGVIIDNNGYIITNNHVIEGAKSIKITLRNGNTYDAKLIGTDADQDVALIKIEPKSDEKLTVATFGNSDKLAVGDKAVAIGNPLGELGGTVTDGIISALDREVEVDGRSMNLLQTDAAINPGNSGGGLFDGQGNLIGIVVAKASGDQTTGTVEGLGFAIPINDAQSIIGDLKDYGRVKGKPAPIGITMQEYMDMVYIYSVTEGSVAEKAGLQKGDKIMKVAGKDVKSSSDVKSAVSKSKAGDTLEFVVERNGKTKTISVVIEEETAENATQPTTMSSYNFDDDFSQWGDFNF